MKKVLKLFKKSEIKERIESSNEYNSFQMAVLYFEHFGLRFVNYVSEVKGQAVIALALSLIFGLVSFFSISEMSSIEISVRLIILSVSLIACVVASRLKMVKETLGEENAFRLIRFIQIVTFVSMIMYMTILRLKIYSSIYMKIFEIMIALFLIASVINKNRDMYNSVEK